MSDENIFLVALAIMFLTGCSQAPVEIKKPEPMSQHFHPDQIWSEMK